jgi:hypothetical protein
MPSCSAKDIVQITNVIENELSDKDKIEASKFIKKVTSKGLCKILHSQRRWYSSQSYSSAKYLLQYRNELKTIMNLNPPIGSFRGFKILRNKELSDRGAPICGNINELKVGDKVKLPVVRNKGCTSFTGQRKFANRFSGKSKDKIGLVVKLINGENIKTFLAPPRKTKKWFNNLYLKTMGKSFRWTEDEFALMVNGFMNVEIVEIKR